MAGAGASYPKPDDQRRTRHRQAFTWTWLAPTPRVRVPQLPGGGWSKETQVWWRALWHEPPAALWASSGITLHAAARLHELIISEGSTPAAEAELRHHLDAHGLSPAAMLRLRWRVGDPGDLEEEPAGRGASRADEARRRRLLRALRDEEAG